MLTHAFADCRHALRMAFSLTLNDAPKGVAYSRKAGGWFVYDLRDGLDADEGEPEFVCVKLGSLPIPLTDYATEMLAQLMTRP